MEIICSCHTSFLSAVSANSVYKDAMEGLLEDSPLTVYAKTKVLRMINERLKDPRTATDSFTALSILHLLISEICSNEDVFDAHHQGLERIVYQRGGLTNSGLDSRVATLMAM